MHSKHKFICYDALPTGILIEGWSRIWIPDKPGRVGRYSIFAKDISNAVFVFTVKCWYRVRCLVFSWVFGIRDIGGQVTVLPKSKRRLSTL